MSTATDLVYSSKRNPCPVCGRTKDPDCRWRPGVDANCHHPRDLKPGEVVTVAGKDWAFTGNTSDGRAAHFVLDKPRDGRQQQRPPLRLVSSSRPPEAPPEPAPNDQPITLAKLLETRPPGGSPLRNGRLYRYSPTQQVRRTDADGGKKRFCPQHLEDGAWVAKAGPDPWPVFNEPDAITAAAANSWILEFEGEKCTELATSAGYVAISQPGHAHKADQIQARYERLAAGGLAGVVYLADADDTGRKRAQQAAEAAVLARLPMVVIHAKDLWPDLPVGGSIDDAPGPIADAMATIEAAAAAAGYRPTSEEPAIGDESTVVKRKDKQSYEKARRLRPDEVLELLPTRVKNPRLNIRSGDIETADGPIPANDAMRLYLKLSSPDETWGKEVTIDALASTAQAAAFDPVEEYLNGIEVSPLPIEQWQRLDYHLLGIDDPIAASFLPQYLISAVARVFEPGCSVRRSPVLVGPQWRGKTALGRILFGADAWVEGVRAFDRDARLRCHTAWGVELAELNGITRRADQETLKAFLTETTDIERRPYDRAPEKMPRRFVFWGTANAAPLRDATGSTRFVCIPIPDRMLPLDWATEHRDQLWARAVEQYRAGVEWDRESEDIRRQVAERNANHQEIDPWADEIAQILREATARPVSLPYVLDRLDIPKSLRNNAMAARVRQLAEACGWVMERRRPAGGGEKKKGLWPADPLAAISGHTGHTVGTPLGTPANPSQAQAFSDSGHTGHPYRTRVVNKKGGTAADAEADADAEAQQEGFEPFGMPGVPTPAKTSPAQRFERAHRPDFGMPSGMPSGMPRAEPPPPWIADAIAARDLAPPGTLPAVLVNRPELAEWRRIPLTGRMVARGLERFDAGEWPELRTQSPAGLGCEL